MTFLYESRFFFFWVELLFLKELLGSFASITSHFVMNHSLLNTICATAFQLAVTVSSVISINSLSPSFVDVVSSWIFSSKTVSKFRVECLWYSLSCRALQLCYFASRVRKFYDGIQSILQQSLRKTFDLECLGWCCSVTVGSLFQ